MEFTLNQVQLVASFLRATTLSMTEIITEVATHHKIDRLEAIQLLAKADELNKGVEEFTK